MYAVSFSRKRHHAILQPVCLVFHSTLWPPGPPLPHRLTVLFPMLIVPASDWFSPSALQLCSMPLQSSKPTWISSEAHTYVRVFGLSVSLPRIHRMHPNHGAQWLSGWSLRRGKEVKMRSPERGLTQHKLCASKKRGSQDTHREEPVKSQGTSGQPPAIQAAAWEKPKPHSERPPRTVRKRLSRDAVRLPGRSSSCGLGKFSRTHMCCLLSLRETWSCFL